MKIYHFSIFFLLFILNVLYTKTEDDLHDDWLHVNDKAEIVDKNGNPVWLTGINWFGFNTGTGFFDGVWMRNFQDNVKRNSRSWL